MHLRFEPQSFFQISSRYNSKTVEVPHSKNFSGEMKNVWRIFVSSSCRMKVISKKMALRRF